MQPPYFPGLRPTAAAISAFFTLADPEDTYPDSGWRIRADWRGLTDDQHEARDAEYIALGKVLNVDDSWLHLIDAPTGARFIRDWETGLFVEESD